jgi:hypothetical protein
LNGPLRLSCTFVPYVIQPGSANKKSPAEGMIANAWAFLSTWHSLPGFLYFSGIFADRLDSFIRAFLCSAMVRRMYSSSVSL